MMEIFHVLPLAAAAVLFIFLATDGQFREIYIAYLEGPNGHVAQWLSAIALAAVILALISAVLCEAHFSLSTMRINVVYSSYSNPDANSKLRSLQRTAAFGLAFLPWLGLAVGLFGARNFVADRHCKLLEEMLAGNLQDTRHLLLPGGWTIAVAIVFLGAATAAFSCIEQRTRIPQRAVALIAPSLAALLFLLFTDWLVFSVNDRWWIIFSSITLVATVLYFIVYQWLYQTQGGLIFARVRSSAAESSSVAPEIDLPRSRGQYLTAWASSFFVSHPEFSTGVSMRRRRRQMLIVWAFVPWLLFALYFVIVPHFAAPMQTSEDWYQAQGQSLCPIAATQVPVPGHWTIFPVAMCCVIGFGLLVGLLLNRFSEQRKWRRIITMGVVGGLAVAAIMSAALLNVDSLVFLYRFIGPLGTVTLQLLFLISTFALLAWLSQRSGFPVLTLALLAIVICVMFPNHAGSTAMALGIVCILFAITAFLSRLYAVGAFALILPILGGIQWYQLGIDKVVQNPPVKVSSGVDPYTAKFQFECWLRQRGIAVQDSDAANQLNQSCPLGAQQPKSSASQKYPVFLIAAEGGGIYAASAASMFLGKVQQDSPRFAEHVFALSGVSGGAIGSTIFQALDKAQSAPAGSATAREPLTQELTEIMEDDHFSPVVGSIFPEILGASAGRAQTLVASFELSTAARDAAAGQALTGPFAQHWAYNSTAPALVLNATWVETGFRVAFAPFHLHDIDESLYSFSDVSMPDEDCPKEKDKQDCVSLMEAAAVSARFPLVLPPFSTEMIDGKRWNFVDGGYTDNTGATTALDLYQILKNVDPDDVNLQIVLVTSSTPQPDLIGKAISGTVFRDTLAPIDALMNVRTDLGNDAVARACSEIFREDGDQQTGAKKKKAGASRTGAKNDHSESNESCIDHAPDPAAPLHIVEIQDQTYGLSLGWKISQTSFDVVSWMLGNASECTTKPPPTADANPPPATDPAASSAANTVNPPDEDVVSRSGGNSKLTRAIVLRNSCVMKSIEGLVEATPAAAPGVANPKSSTQ
jgi:hypothetical protein